MNTLHVLSADGDTRLSWDPANPDEVAEARQQVTDLKEKGYSFFLLDGAPAPDEVDAGQGQLSCRRVDAEALLPAATVEPEATLTAAASVRTFERGGKGKKRCPACERYVANAQHRCACGHVFPTVRSTFQAQPAAATPAAATPVAATPVAAAPSPSPADETRAIAMRPLRGG